MARASRRGVGVWRAAAILAVVALGHVAGSLAEVCGSNDRYGDLKAACDAQAGFTWVQHLSTAKGGCYAKGPAAAQEDAHQDCIARATAAGGQWMGGLAVMNDVDENWALFKTDTQGWAGSSQYWFALVQLPGSAEPYCGWTNFGGCPSVYQAWGGSEPNNSGGEDCTHSITNGFWNDLNCARTLEYVCEFQLTTCRTDTDGDLIMDACEVPGFENNPDISGGVTGLKCNNNLQVPDLSNVDPADVICADSDNDGVCDHSDAFPNDPAESADSDGDGTGDNADGCPNDIAKLAPLICGCGVADEGDADGDLTLDCVDDCPSDPGKTEEGLCGCGVSDADADNDQTPDCDDACPNDPAKTEEGLCGCGVPDDDSDNDGTPDCADKFPNDPFDGIVPCSPDTTVAGNVLVVEGTGALIWPRADCERSATVCGEAVAILGGVEYVALESGEDAVSTCTVFDQA